MELEVKVVSSHSNLVSNIRFSEIIQHIKLKHSVSINYGSVLFES